MPIVRSKRNGKIVSPYWYYDFRFGGHRYRETTNTTNKAEARLIEAEALAAVKNGRPAARTGRKAPLLRDYLDEFLTVFSASQQRSPNSKRYYRNGKRLLMATPLRDVPIDQVSRAIVAAVRFTGSGSNANNAIRTLRACLGYALEQKVLQTAPELELYEERERKDTYSPQQEADLIAHADEDTGDAFVLLIDSGVRPEECCRFEIDWVKWEHNLIRVVNGKSRGYSRDIPMTDRIRTMFVRRLKRLATSKFTNHRTMRFMFPSKKKGKHLSLQTLRDGFNNAKKLAGLPDDLVLYCTRHTFGTDMAELRNPKLTMLTMGHRQLKTSARYQHPETMAISGFLNERNAKRKSLTTAEKNGQTFGQTNARVN